MTSSVKIVLDTIPPTIGAAMRFITLAPAPCPQRIGSKPAMIAVTVIIFGRTRSTAPSITASYSFCSVGTAPFACCAFHAWSR